jgi:hypothetical protein
MLCNTVTGCFKTLLLGRPFWIRVLIALSLMHLSNNSSSPRGLNKNSERKGVESYHGAMAIKSSASNTIAQTTHRAQPNPPPE